MTKLPNDDERLVDFLRQHAGDPPPAAPKFEEQLMQAVASSPQWQRLGRRQKWILPSAIAASLLFAWTGYRVLMPPPPPDASLAEFMENNWDSVVGEVPEPDLLSGN
jgi:hypothetical protein